MFDFIMQYWVETVFSLIIAAVTTCYKSLRKEMDAQTIEQEAMKTAIVAMLRQSIYDAYNKWSERGYCPIYAMEVVTKVYEQYHALGGNNVGTELYERLRELPTQPTGENTATTEQNKKVIKEEM